MGRYFTKFKLRDSRGNYNILADSLSNSISTGETVLSSLNYDLLFEDAVTREVGEITYFPNSIPGECVFLKPHGSCNFNINIEGDGIDFDEGVQFSGKISQMHRTEIIRQWESDECIPPSMSYYRSDKYTQIGEDDILDIRGMWKRVVENASRIGIIGVKPYKEDDHIWGPLSETDAQIIYIGGQDHFKNWTAEFRDRNDIFISERFGDGIDTFLSHF